MIAALVDAAGDERGEFAPAVLVNRSVRNEGHGLLEARVSPGHMSIVETILAGVRVKKLEISTTDVFRKAKVKCMFQCTTTLEVPSYSNER